MILARADLPDPGAPTIATRSPECSRNDTSVRLAWPGPESAHTADNSTSAPRNEERCWEGALKSGAIRFVNLPGAMPGRRAVDKAARSGGRRKARPRRANQPAPMSASAVTARRVARSVLVIQSHILPRRPGRAWPVHELLQAIAVPANEQGRRGPEESVKTRSSQQLRA